MPRILDKTDQELLVQLIYQHKLGGRPLGEDLLSELGISQSKAYSLLRRARDQDILQTTAAIGLDPHEELTIAVRKAAAPFGVERVLVLASTPDDRAVDTPRYRMHLRRNLGAFAARYLATLELEEGSHLAFGGGRTMAELAQRFTPNTRNLVVRPLTSGGSWRVVRHVEATTVLQILHLRLGFPIGEGISVVSPGISPGPVRDVVDRPDVRAVFGESAPRPAVTICSLGRRRYQPMSDPDEPGPHPDTSSYVQDVATAIYHQDKASAAELRRRPLLIYEKFPDAVYRRGYEYLKDKNIIGDVCRVGFTEAGQTRKTVFEERSLSVHPTMMRTWAQKGTNTVCVLGGTRLGPVLRAALRGGFFRTLIVDLALAVQLVPIHERPELYQDIPEITDIEDGLPLPPA